MEAGADLAKEGGGVTVSGDVLNIREVPVTPLTAAMLHPSTDNADQHDEFVRYLLVKRAKVLHFPVI